METTSSSEREAEYHSTDFDWEQLRQEIENLPSFSYHLSSHTTASSTAATLLQVFSSARESIVVYACDCSDEIIQKAKEIVFSAKSITRKDRFIPFILDFSNNEFPEWLFCTSCQNSSSAKSTNSENSHETEEHINSSILEGNRCCVGGVDFVIMIFTLSAVPFGKMSYVIQKYASIY